jgi:hypothetical protein
LLARIADPRADLANGQDHNKNKNRDQRCGILGERRPILVLLELAENSDSLTHGSSLTHPACLSPTPIPRRALGCATERRVHSEQDLLVTDALNSRSDSVGLRVKRCQQRQALKPPGWPKRSRELTRSSPPKGRRPARRAARQIDLAVATGACACASTTGRSG